jgi:DNA-binding MarR family transcriptional regulator/predicted GNAT family acetyltransferase
VDTLNELGVLALASRLKRLSDRLMKDVSAIYHDCDIDFEARWFTIFYTLNRNKKLSVTELADALSISHTAVNHITTELIRRGWVKSEKGTIDERRRLLSITREGKNTLKKLESIWDKIRIVTEDLIRESQCDVITDLNCLEKQLNQRDMYARIRQELSNQIKKQVDILEYKPAYKKYFKSLNHEWLEEYFDVEPIDEKVLNDPRGQIIQTGGSLFFARLNGKIVGTCALQKHGSEILEITKMAVTRSARGLGIGKQLSRAAIQRAKQLGAKTIYLQTSAQLRVANKLYRQLGFKKIDNGPLSNRLYRRKTYTMRLILDKK